MGAFLIVGNGPFLPKKLLLEAKANKTVIALDGAADKLDRMGIKPAIILGDMDSIQQPERWGICATKEAVSKNDAPYFGHDAQIVPALDQNKTDLEKAIAYCDQAQATSIDIVCVLGRSDHLLLNVGALKHYAHPQRSLAMLTATERIRYVHNSTTHLKGKPNQPCGIMAYPKAYATSKGLKWELKDYPLVLAKSESACNRLLGTRADIHIKGDALIIEPGHLDAQQENMGKSHEEIWLEVLKDLRFL